MVRRPATAAAAALLCACAGARGAGAGAAPASLPPPPAADVHHDLKVTLVPERSLVLVEDEITLSPALRARLGDRVTFLLHAGLSPERAGRGPDLAAAPGAARDAGAADAGADPRVPVEAFAVALAPGERTFTVRYGGPIHHPVEERGEEYARKFGTTPGLVRRDGAFLAGASRWVPDLGQPLLSFTLEVHLPPSELAGDAGGLVAGWQAVSQGTRTRHERDAGGTVVRWESPEPQEEVYLVAGPLVERAASGGGRVAVSTFLREDDRALAERYLGAGVEYLRMYEALLGPYPYAKWAVVENFWETGYGMPSFTLLGPRVLRLPFIVRSSYPHEILHSWWGNGVYVDARRGNWCEGLTAYLADHLVAEQGGRGADHRRSSLQSYADYVTGNRETAVREFRARHGAASQSVGYDKVLMTFHMLRQRLGDERFVEGLRRLYAEHRFRAASFTDVVRTLGAAAGEDLEPFFAQWVDRPGAPELRLEAAEVVEREGVRSVEVVLAQVQAGEPYALDVPIHLTVPPAPHALRRTVRLTGRRERLSIPVGAAPVRVDVDPEFDLFRRLDPAEVPAALSGAFGAQRRIVVLPAAAPRALREAYAAVAARWSEGATEVVGDDALERIPPGASAWILGWENRLLPQAAAAVAPYGAALDDRGVRFGATALSRDAHAVVAVGRSPADPGQVIAFLGADVEAALPGLARKLPHYGRYGLLGFQGEEPANVAKETWDVLASPMARGLVAGGALPPRAPPPPRQALAPAPPPAPAAGTPAPSAPGR